MMKKIILTLIASITVVVGIISIDNNHTIVDQINQDISITPPAAGGTTYYVCDTGDDSNSGSKSSPFKSYEKAIDTFNKMFAGGSVLFCRGGEFPITKAQWIFNKHCGPSAVCTLADYGNENSEKPKIIATDTNALDFQDSGTADHDGGYLVKNIILFSTTHTKKGVFIYNDVDDVVLDNLHIEGFAVGIHVAGSQVPNTGSNGRSERITLKNSVIINNDSQGWLGASDDCLIEDNVFESNGHGIFDHNIYLASDHFVDRTGIVVRGNSLYKSSLIDGKCKGVSLVAHGLLNDLVIEDNLIKEDVGAVTSNCWGISVDPGYTDEEAFRNVIIKNNKLINMGNIGIGCASCDGAIIENNIITDEAEVLAYGIAVPVRVEDSVKSRNVRVANNTIVMSQMVNPIAGISVGGANPVLVQGNNIILPNNPHGICISSKDASENIDTSSNTCSNHVSTSVIHEKIGTLTTQTNTDAINTDAINTDAISTDAISADAISADAISTDVTPKAPRSRSNADTETNSHVVSLGYYNNSRSKSGLIVNERKCRAEAADGRCLLR